MPDRAGEGRSKQKNTFFVINVLITPHPPCRAPSPLAGRRKQIAYMGVAPMERHVFVQAIQVGIGMHCRSLQVGY